VSLGEKRFRVVKSKAGRRTIAIPPILLDELERHYQRTPFKADDDRVFCHARRGGVYSAEMWRPLFDTALKAAGIHDHGSGHARPRPAVPRPETHRDHEPGGRGG
jgi:hypothetical protein